MRDVTTGGLTNDLHIKAFLLCYFAKMFRLVAKSFFFGGGRNSGWMNGEEGNARQPQKRYAFFPVIEWYNTLVAVDGPKPKPLISTSQQRS